MTEIQSKTRRLIDDCFHTDPRDGRRMSHNATLALLRARISPVTEIVELPLSEVVGRISAEDVSAGLDVPGHTNSAVDGYAFDDESYDREAGTLLSIGGRAAAGRPMGDPLPQGTAARIFTGAILPEGATSVAMQEDCEVRETVEGPRLFIPPGLKANANVRLAGEDVERGAPILAAGQVLRAPEVAALASVGCARVSCRAPVRVAIVSTGDEVVREARPLKPGEVYDVNAPLLAALVQGRNVALQDFGVWPDCRMTVVNRLREAAGHCDLILTSGGASLGEEDHVSHALAELGTRHFWQIAVKPGRPLMFGQIGDTVVVGLPGNPVAVFVCCLMYVLPIIRRLGGGAWREPRRFPLPAAFEVPGRKLGRREFWRGTTRMGEEGLVVEKFPRDGSGLISGLRAADGLIDIHEDVPSVRRGQLVDFIPYSEFGIFD